jgi:hypothetical protein
VDVLDTVPEYIGLGVPVLFAWEDGVASCSPAGVTVADIVATVGVGVIFGALGEKFLTPTATIKDRNAATTTAIGIRIQ